MTHPTQRLYEGPKKEKEYRKQLRQEQQNALVPVAQINECVEPIKATAIITPRDTPLSVSPKEQKHSIVGISVCGLFLALAILLGAATELGVYITDGYHENGYLLPSLLLEAEKWVSVSRNVYSFLLLLGLPGIGRYLARRGKPYSSTACWIGVVFLFYNGFLVNAGWNSTTSHSTARGNVSALEAGILQQPDIALAKESYEIALADKRKAETDEKYQCSQSDGTKCVKAKSRTAEANKSYEAKQQTYSALVIDAKRKANQDANPAQSDIAHLVEWITHGYVRPSEHDIANQQLFFRTAIALAVGLILALLV